MLQIYFHPNGKAFSDFDLITEAEDIINNYKLINKNQSNLTYQSIVSTGNIIETLRLLVSRDVIPYNDIQVLFKGNIITLNDKIEWSNYPKGFLDGEKLILKEITQRRIGKI